MASFVFLLGLLPLARGLVPDAVRPGALVAPEGSVLMVEDVVNVAYDIGPLQQVSNQIPLLAQRLSGLHDVFRHMLDMEHSGTLLDPALNMSLQLSTQRMGMLHTQIVALADAFPSNSVAVGRTGVPSRKHRGLFDFGGLLLNKLFGTAMAEDVSALGEKLSVVTQVVQSQNRLLWKEHAQLERFRSHFNAMVKRSNVLSEKFHKLEDQVATFENIFLLDQYLHGLDSDIKTLRESCSSVIDSLVNAGLSRVNSDLLPLDHLRAAIHFARANFSLTPLFEGSQLEFYYPLLEATLTDSQILVHIPLKSEVTYAAYSVNPFPMRANSSLLSLVTHSDMFLVADDFMTVSLTTKSLMSECRSSYLHIHVCPAYLFALLPATSAQCELAIVRNTTNLIHKFCTFEPVSTSWPVYHAHVGGGQYFYFKEAASVTLLCEGNSVNLIAEGYYVAPDSCEVRSSAISTLPTKHHLGFETILPTSLVPLSPFLGVYPENLTIVSDRLKVLSYLNDSDVFVASAPFFFRPHVLYPTVSIPIVLFLVMFGLLCVCLKRLDSRLTDIREAANLEIVPPSPQT